jgi:methyl-accepting chemotaxis protein WspA
MPRLSDLTIRTRLYCLVAFSTAALATVLALAGYVMSRYRINGPLYREIVFQKDLLAEIEPAVLDIRGSYLVVQTLTTVTDSETVDQLTRILNGMEKRYREAQELWRNKLPEGPIKQGVTVNSYDPADEFYNVTRQEMLPLLGGSDKDKRERRLALFQNKLKPKYDEHKRALEGVRNLVHKEIERDAAEASRWTNFWLDAMLVISIGSVLAVGLLGVITTRSIVRSTRVLSRRVNEMASGASDLTARVEVDSRDEIGHLAAGINAMIAKIRTVVSRVRESSVQLLATASELAATARQQDATVQGLSTSTAEVAAAVREISATSKELSGTMNEVNERSTRTATLASAGRTHLAAMEATMQQLVDSTASISSKLGIIREKADGINVVVTTITKVADQTNLLSINAAIEAEKAGEYGRGFLVVAREIRRLADQTAVATLDIENMVRHMQDAVSAGVMQMDKFSGEVRNGAASIAEVNGQTGEIITEVQGLTPRFRQVNESMRQQSIGAEQINEAMVQMADSSRQTASALDELKRATAHLRQSVELLNQEINQFTV